MPAARHPDQTDTGHNWTHHCPSGDRFSFPPSAFATAHKTPRFTSPLRDGNAVGSTTLYCCFNAANLAASDAMVSFSVTARKSCVLENLRVLPHRNRRLDRCFSRCSPGCGRHSRLGAFQSHWIRIDIIKILILIIWRRRRTPRQINCHDHRCLKRPALLFPHNWYQPVFADPTTIFPPWKQNRRPVPTHKRCSACPPPPRACR